MDEQKRVIALGFFDGVHIGHAALLNQTKECADKLGLRPSVLSFDIHPDTLVFHREVPLINSAAGREELIRRHFGIEEVIFLHFNESLMRMPWEEFIEQLVTRLEIAHIVVGHDFCFGYRGQGTTQRLKEYCDAHGIGCDIIPAVTCDGEIVSSTRIRALLQEGRVEEANRLLGHRHTLCDTVHFGYQLGSKIGSPTINMFFPEGVLVPRRGVYTAYVTLEDGRSYPAVTNIGVRPTVSEGERVSVESHLLDYEGNLYGRQVRLEFESFQRDEMRFESVEALSRQIERDTEQAREYFQHKKEQAE